ncbi:MAG TPA: hypothetical protein VNO51_11225 [Ilumatobacteraceae bacterium]|nr:hypothetical protein [Ilumatobacteraceae bacterium]
MESPDTVTDAVVQLQTAGFDADFHLEDTGMRCEPCQRVHQTQHLVIVERFRFEGESDPGDSSIVLGVECPSCGARGVVVSSFGAAAEPQLIALLQLLDLD